MTISEPQSREPTGEDHPSPRLRVLVLTAYPAMGGPLPKIAPLLLRGLQDCGCEVKAAGWSAHHAGHEPLFSKMAGRAGDMVRVARRVRGWHPDVVYVASSHGWPSLLRDIPLTVMLNALGAPVVLHLHGSESDLLGQRGQRLFTACSIWLARRVGAVLLLSSEELEPWRRVCPGVRLAVVVNPFVPARREIAATRRPTADRTPTLLVVARLAPGKGVFDALDAIEIVGRRRPCRLVFAGEGPARAELARRIESQGLSDSVELLGYVSGADLERAYEDADVFVLASYVKEGFPLSVMEAMGYGLPVITTARRGCADSLEPDVHAVFVSPRDPKALAEAIERLLDDDDLRARMGQANLAKVAEFAPDRAVPRYAEVLRLVAEANGWQPSPRSDPEVDPS